MKIPDSRYFSLEIKIKIMKFIIGKKVGMTQIYDKNGKVTPVTVIEAGPCFVTQIKTDDKDGYKSMDECQSKKIAYVCDRSIEALPSCNLVEYDDKDGIPKDSYESIERCQSNCKKSTNKLLIGIGIGVTVLLILIFITLSTRRPLSREVPRL